MRIAGQTIETADDVQRICDEGWLESQQVEFKREVGDGSKIAKEVVALANHLGGHVVIGIDESDEAPARAARIATIANAGDAASRLERQLRDKIDPPIRGLVVHPIGTAADGAGVIIIEVPQSLFGPHRSGHDWRVYQRSGTESRPLTMTEIHRLVLAFEKREDRVEQRFQAIRGPIGFPHDVCQGKLCFRVAAVPLGDIELDLTAFQRPWFSPIKIRTMRGGERSSAIHPDGASFRPTLRGRIAQRKTEALMLQVNLGRNGTSQFLYLCRSEGSSAPTASHMLAAVYSALAIADEIAQKANYLGGQFGVEVEFGARDACELLCFGPEDREAPLQTGLRSQRFMLPRFPYSPGDDKNAIVDAVWSDFWNALERDPPDEIVSVEPISATA